jgi:DNA repair protein RadC
VPSGNDRIVTVRIEEAANYMDLILLDHLILTPEEEFYSMVDNGLF